MWELWKKDCVGNIHTELKDGNDALSKERNVMTWGVLLVQNANGFVIQHFAEQQNLPKSNYTLRTVFVLPINQRKKHRQLRNHILAKNVTSMNAMCVAHTTESDIKAKVTGKLPAS